MKFVCSPTALEVAATPIQPTSSSLNQWKRLRGAEAKTYVLLRRGRSTRSHLSNIPISAGNLGLVPLKEELRVRVSHGSCSAV